MSFHPQSRGSSCSLQASQPRVGAAATIWNLLFAHACLSAICVLIISTDASFTSLDRVSHGNRAWNHDARHDRTLLAELLPLPLDFGAAGTSARGTDPGTTASGESAGVRTALVRASKNSCAATPPRQQAAGANTSINLTCSTRLLLMRSC